MRPGLVKQGWHDYDSCLSGTDLITVKTIRMKQIFVLLLFASLRGFSQDYAKQFAIPAHQTLSSTDNEDGPYEVVIKKNNSYEPGFLKYACHH